MQCRDVFDRIVHLEDSDWVEIASLRPAVADKHGGIEVALTKPNMVTEDREGRPRRHYYKRSTFDPPYERGWLKVTVDPRRVPILGRTSYSVIDVALVSEKPAKERKIWPPLRPGQRPPM